MSAKARLAVSCLCVLSAHLGAGCEQDPDLVVRSLTDQSGAAGEMPLAGMGVPNAGASAGTSTDSPASCDPEEAATYALLAGVERDECGFSLRDIQLVTALGRFIFNQPRPMPMGETRPIHPACDLFDQPGYLDPERSDRAILCPEYCDLLTEWLITNEAFFRDCLPDEEL